MTGARMTECQGCSKCWPEDLLDALRDPFERVLPGDEMPAGECPDCGAACMVLDAAPTTSPAPTKSPPDRDHGICVAYLYGWRDGHDVGEDTNPYTDDERRHFYRAGYDRGVIDYCVEEGTESRADEKMRDAENGYARIRDDIAGDLYHDMMANSSNEDLCP